MAKASVETCRIRDAVRGSKIRMDILKKLDRQLDFFDSELNQGTIELHDWSKQYQTHGRVFPRSAKGVEDCINVPEYKCSPTAGSDRRNHLREANRRWMRSYLPLLKHTSNKEDLFKWFDVVDVFFEGTQPLENTRCELASYVLGDEAEQWWRQLQHRRLLDGESEIKLWRRMKFLLSNDFWSAKCSIKCSAEVYKTSNRNVTYKKTDSQSPVVVSSSGLKASIKMTPAIEGHVQQLGVGKKADGGIHENNVGAEQNLSVNNDSDLIEKPEKEVLVVYETKAKEQLVNEMPGDAMRICDVQLGDLQEENHLHLLEMIVGQSEKIIGVTWLMYTCHVIVLNLLFQYIILLHEAISMILFDPGGSPIVQDIVNYLFHNYGIIFNNEEGEKSSTNAHVDGCIPSKREDSAQIVALIGEFGYEISLSERQLQHQYIDQLVVLTKSIAENSFEESWKQSDMKSNNIELLVGEMLMVSFDPGGKQRTLLPGSIVRNFEFDHLKGTDLTRSGAVDVARQGLAVALSNYVQAIDFRMGEVFVFLFDPGGRQEVQSNRDSNTPSFYWNELNCEWNHTMASELDMKKSEHEKVNEVYWMTSETTPSSLINYSFLMEEFVGGSVAQMSKFIKVEMVRKVSTLLFDPGGSCYLSRTKGMITDIAAEFILSRLSRVLKGTYGWDFDIFLRDKAAITMCTLRFYFDDNNHMTSLIFYEIGMFSFDPGGISIFQKFGNYLRPNYDILLMNEVTNDRKFNGKSFGVLVDMDSYYELYSIWSSSKELVLYYQIIMHHGLNVRLHETTVSQDHVVDVVTMILFDSRAGLGSLRMTGLSSFLGSMGVLKREFPGALVEHFDDDKLLVWRGMPTHVEPHSVSHSIRALPRCLDHAEGRQLLEAVKMQNYIVVEFDEVEKTCSIMVTVLLFILEMRKGRCGSMKQDKSFKKGIFMTPTCNSLYCPHSAPLKNGYDPAIAHGSRLCISPNFKPVSIDAVRETGICLNDMSKEVLRLTTTESWTYSCNNCLRYNHSCIKKLHTATGIYTARKGSHIFITDRGSIMRYSFNLTRERVIQLDGWNDKKNDNMEKKLIMAEMTVIIDSYEIVLWENIQSRGSLKLFHNVVNGLDPPVNLEGACDAYEIDLAAAYPFSKEFLGGDSTNFYNTHTGGTQLEDEFVILGADGDDVVGLREIFKAEAIIVYSCNEGVFVLLSF